MKQNDIKFKIDNEVKELHAIGDYKISYVGTDTQGASRIVCQADSWEELFNKMWEANYINKETIESATPYTENDYKNLITFDNASDAYYQTYLEREDLK